MKRRTIVILPPRGTRIPTLRIRVSLLVFIAVVLCAGFAGYFIPFNSLTLDLIQQNQKRNLSQQNVALLGSIRELGESTRQLDRSILQLEVRKDSMAALAYLNDPESSEKVNGLSEEKSEKELLVLLEKNEHMVTHVVKSVEKDPSFFDDIPVISPVAGQSFISAEFGETNDPFTGGNKLHFGIDFVAEKGAPVVATADGRVSRVENDRAWGRRIIIKHRSGFVTIYAHLGSVEVGVGRRVKKGQRIGTLGSSGVSSGPHLHYEIRKGKTHLDPQLMLFPELEGYADLALPELIPEAS